VQIIHEVYNHWKDYFSNCLPIKYDVPEGSVLGPLPFIIYVNNIPKLNSDMTIIYADDTSMLRIGKLRTAINYNTQSAIHNIYMASVSSGFLKQIMPYVT
jgi:hypothetical protein